MSGFLPELSSAAGVLCLALAHFLWQGAAITFVAVVLGALLRRASAQAQYLALCAGMLLLPVALVATTLSLARQSAGETAIVPPPVWDDAAAGEILRLGVIAQTPRTVTWLDWAMENGALPLAIAYLGGVVLLAARLMLGLGGARRLCRTAAPLTEMSLTDFVGKQSARLRLPTPPIVSYCRDVAVPTVVGVLRPTILLPLSAASGLTPAELQAILTHELIHIRRYDHIALVVQRLIEALCFFHPAVWYLSRKISDVREHCCDDRVLALGTERQLYIESLLRVAELSFAQAGLTHSTALAGLFAAEQPSRLRTRILRLLDQPLAPPVRLRPLAIAAMAALLLVIGIAPLALTAFAQAGEDNPEEAVTPGNQTELINKEFDQAISFALISARRGQTAEGFRGRYGDQFGVDIVGATDGRVWGTDVYTDDSDIATAAVHAGLVKEGEAATVTVTIVKSPPKHRGSVRHGVTTLKYGAHPSSFVLHRQAEAGEESAIRLGLDYLRQRQEITETRDEQTQTLLERQRLEEWQAKEEERQRQLDHQQELLWAERSYRHCGSDGEFIRRAYLDVLGVPATSDQILEFLEEEGEPEKKRALLMRRLARQAAESGTGTKRTMHGCAACHSNPFAEAEVDLERDADLMKSRKALRGWIEATAQRGDATAFRGKFGKQFEVEIVGATDGYIWGTDTYTDDSPIAVAAVHAGLVKPGEKATVIVTVVESPEWHEGSERHGVTSRDYGKYHSSYVLHRKAKAQEPKPAQNDRQKAQREFRPRDPHSDAGMMGAIFLRDTIRQSGDNSRTAMRFLDQLGKRVQVEIVGSTDGDVWGTDTYTADSDIATAAVHAGVVEVGETAVVTLTMVESPSVHKGSTRHGIRSRSFGEYPASYVLERSSVAESLLGEITWFQRAKAAAPADAVAFREQFGKRIEMEVMGVTTGTIYGTDVYSDDSDIATAAVHAGVLEDGETAKVIITIVQSPETFDATERHGVKSGRSRSCPSAFILQRAP